MFPPFIPDCSGNSTSRLQIASSGLSSLPPSDIQVLTDGSVPFFFGPGGAGVYAPNATHRIPYPFSPVQLPPASQLKPLPSSKVLLGVLAIDDLQIPVSPFPNRLSISLLYPFFSPSYRLPESLWYVWSLASSLSNNTSLSFNGSPDTQVSPEMKKRIYLPKLVPLCPLMRSQALSLQLVPKSVIANTAIGDVTSHTPI